MELREIYCDESGFTGQNLLDPDQRFFAYGSVAISPEEATELVARTIRDSRLQGRELKGKNLLKNAPGRRAATSLLRELGNRSQVAVVHKRFALACKLFEYAFESLISDVSMCMAAVDWKAMLRESDENELRRRIASLDGVKDADRLIENPSRETRRGVPGHRAKPPPALPRSRSETLQFA